MGRSTSLLSISFSFVFDSFLPQTHFFLFVAFRGLHFPKEEVANQFHRFEQVFEILDLHLLERSTIAAHFVLDYTPVYWSF